MKEIFHKPKVRDLDQEGEDVLRYQCRFVCAKCR